MRTSNGRSYSILSVLVLLGSSAGASSTLGCTSDQSIAKLPDGSVDSAALDGPAAPDAPAEEDAGSDATGVLTCASSQVCVEFTPAGPACLPACTGGDAGECPSGEVCTSTSGCCEGTGCSAVRVMACCPPSGCDTPSDAGAQPDTGGLPSCSTDQRCVENTPDGPACLPACAGLDAGGCPTGEVCTRTSGCCEGTGCDAVSVFACCPAAGCATRPDAGAPADGGLPSCSSDQRCAEYTPDGPACLPACAGLDAGGCPTGEVCTYTSGCCVGTACSAVAVLVCCPPAGCDTRPDGG